MIQDIWNALFTLIDGTVDTVYNYEPKQPDEYPCISITPNNSTESMFGSNSNLAEVPYNIRIMVQYNDQSQAEDDIRWYVDTVLELLRWDIYLWWLAMSSKFEVERGYTNEEQSNRIAIIKAIYTVLVC